jgi:serine/threonine-protein kinase
MKAAVAIQWKGDLSAIEKQFSSVPPEADSGGVITWLRVGILTLDRKLPETLELVQQFHGETLATLTTAPCPKALLEGRLYQYQGDKEKARIGFEHARVVADKLVREAPQDSIRHGQLGLVLAGLGQKDEAIKEGKRAVELLPESQDAFDGPQSTATLAQIYVATGKFDEAFRLLDHLLDVPNGLTIAILKLEPMWDPLRKDPRFQALIDKYSPLASPKT